MKSLLGIFQLGALLLTLPLLAQQAPNNALGFQPAKSFQMGDYDTVNLFNGNLTVALPIGPSFTPGGGLTYGLHLIYNGNAWVMQGDTVPEAIPNRFSNAGLGGKVTLGELVAPNDPAILDISTGDNWVYLGADGSVHTFSTTLHDEEIGTAYAGSDSLIPNTVVGYTRDGSYLRLLRGTRIINSTHACPPPNLGFCNDYTVSYSIEASDGNIHTFEGQITKPVSKGDPTVQEDAKLAYRLVSIVDRFGNYLHVTYPDPLTWVLKNGTPADGDIRTHTIHLISMTFYEYAGQATEHLFVSSIDLAAFNGQTATYQFNYSDFEEISKNCDDQYSNVKTKTRFLNSVTQPDGSTFGLTYNKFEYDAAGVITCSQRAGHLLKLALPTGGNIQYTLEGRRFPTYPDELAKAIPGTWRDHSASVATRTLYDANNASSGTWTYHADLTDPADYHHPPNDTVTRVDQGLAITVKDPLQRTTVSYYSVDHFGPGLDQSCYDNAVEELEYAMPFTRTRGTATADGLLLSSEIYDSPCTIQVPLFGSGFCARTCNDASNAPVQPSRSTYVQYELDAGSNAGDQNRRVKRSRTVFNNDTGCGGACYEETEFGDFDGLGHYRTATHRSNFAGTSPRVTTTHYNARGGTYVPGGGSSPDAYMILPASPWLPGVYDFQTTAENGQSARSEECFNATTAFLERRRTWRSGDRTHDLLATFDQTNGNVTAESYFGGDSQPLSGGFATCTSSTGTAAYRLTHHYTFGSVDSTQYDGVTFKSLDLTIDKNTGLTAASRDTSALLETGYTYDTMQRLTEVRPPGDAWTKYTYTFGTPTTLSIIRRPFGSTLTAAAETSNYLYFDSFGRSVLSKEQYPEGWSSTTTSYDLAGRVVSTSMPQFRSDSLWEVFTPAHVTTTTYDRFDRTMNITMPDTKSTTFSYTGNRVTARTACLSASAPSAPCAAGEQPFTTTEIVDGHGRLISVTEPLGSNGLTTSYVYDVGNRLTSVSMNAPEGTQHRTFTYDLAGFLTSETHPEKGANGGGSVNYPEYDARGHLRHRIDGATGGSFDTTFVYDSSERLTHVMDIDPATHDRRDLKVFAYAANNATENPRLGKLDTATRHNYQPSLGGDIAVAETYTYGGLNGRLSARDTAISGAFPANTFSLAQTWNDLGNIASITYPTNSAMSSTPRTITYSYTNALLTGIIGYTTGITHLANGLVSHIAHQNGENEDWGVDPNGMSRPASIHITSGSGADKLIGPYAYDASGNIKQIGDPSAAHTTYQYDGAGRLAASVDFTSPSFSNSQTFNYDSFGNKFVIGAHQFDPNGDRVLDPSDIFYLVNYLFLSGPAPRGAAGLLSGDANGDGAVDPSDIFFLVNFLFLGGTAPSVPIEAPPGGPLVPIIISATDSVTVGTVNATGNTVDVPVYIRDISGNSLGRDQAAGSKIQSFSIKVSYSPVDSVSSVTFTRAGITSSLAPSAAFNPATAGSISLVDTFQESSNLIPLTLNAAAPGDLVAHLVFTLSGRTDLGSAIAIRLDPSRTLLSDEGGNRSESAANGKLVLVDGGINVPSQMMTTPHASMASTPAETGSTSPIKAQASPRPARFLSDARRATSSTHFSPRTSNSYTGTTNHDAAFTYDDAGDVLHDDAGRSFTYDALSMTTGATVTLSNGGTRNFAYLYTADDERIALVEKLAGGATTTNWTLRGLDNHLLRTWTSSTPGWTLRQDQTSSTSGWSWREDEIWRGASLLANESASGVRHYGLDHLGSPAILTDASGHPIGNITFDAFGNGGTIGAGMLQYTGHERDSVNVGSSPGTVALPDYLHARYYDSPRGRFLSLDKHPGDAARPQSWNRFVYTSNNPLIRFDPDGLHDIYVMIWNAQAPYFFGRGSVGHVAAFETDGRLILSQFPNPHGSSGMNTPLSYENTVAMEKRMPNSVFKVFVPNDKQFDAVVNAKKADQTWVTLPVDDGTTNCVNSVGMALDAGSVPIQEPNMRPDWPVTPGQLDSRLRDLMNGSNSQAWSVQQAPVDVLGTPFFQAPASFWSTLLSMLPF